MDSGNFLTVLRVHIIQKEMLMNKNNQKKMPVPDWCRIPYGNFCHWSGLFDPDRKFTDSLHGSFGFVILISIILAAYRAVK